MISCAWLGMSTGAEVFAVRCVSPHRSPSAAVPAVPQAGGFALPPTLDDSMNPNQPPNPQRALNIAVSAISNGITSAINTVQQNTGGAGLNAPRRARAGHGARAGARDVALVYRGVPGRATLRPWRPAARAAPAATTPGPSWEVRLFFCVPCLWRLCREARWQVLHRFHAQAHSSSQPWVGAARCLSWPCKYACP